MKLEVFDAVLCPKYSNEMVIVENCKGRKEGKPCSYFKGEGKTGGLFPILAEIDCSYNEN